MQMYEGRAQVALRPKTTQQVSQVWHRPAPQDFQQGSLHLLQSTMPVPRDHMLHAGWVSTLAWDVPDLLLKLCGCRSITGTQQLLCIQIAVLTCPDDDVP